MTNDPESTNAQLLASAELCGRLRYNASIWQRKADDDHPLVKDQLDAANAIDRLAYQAQGYCKDAKHAESVADELRRLLEKEKERADKFMWQVRDTCARAESSESLVVELREKVERLMKALEDIYRVGDGYNEHRPEDGKYAGTTGEGHARCREIAYRARSALEGRDNG